MPLGPLHTLYGIDIKLPPEGPPRVIEINGTDSGTDFYKMPDHGEPFYRAAGRAFAKASQGKPILLGTSRYQPWRRKEPEVIDINPLVTRALPADLYSFQEALFPFEHAWYQWLLYDSEEFEHADHDDGYPHESTFYALGCRKEGLEALLFTELEKSTAEPGSYLARLADREGGFGEKFRDRNTNRKLFRFCNPEDYGLLWMHTSTVNHFKNLDDAPDPFFLGSPVAEYVLGHKGALYAVLTRATGPDAPLIPRTFTYMPGITRPEELGAFIADLPGEIVVHKPAGRECGVGVRILPKKELLSELETGPRRLQHMDCMVQLAFRTGLVHNAFIIQEFITSKPVTAERDGRPRDGCIRGILIDGKWVGGQWRLAPNPIDTTDLDYDGRFRCNLSRGAFPQYLTDQEEAVVAPYAERVIQAFEQTIQPAVTDMAGHAEDLDRLTLELSSPATRLSWKYALQGNKLLPELLKSLKPPQ